MAQPVAEDQERIKWGAMIANDGNDRWYKSFICKGVEYSLYDCVYLYRGGLETDIGRIIMLCETNKGKRAKVIWFFRPSDISNFLGDYKPSWDELFLACGKGKGVSNLVPLEVIIGKCNVICTSKSNRNVLPSKSDAVNADYFFSHVFDVDKLRLLEELPDTIGPVKVERLLNRPRDKPKAKVKQMRVARIGSETEDAKKLGASDIQVQSPVKNPNMTSNPFEQGTLMFERSLPGNQPLKKRKIQSTMAELDSTDNQQQKEKSVRPTTETHRWLQNMPWEEKLLMANEQRRLVTLVNLDPSCTSLDVQGMILNIFKLKVEAKIIPHRSFFGPINGQALVIFRSRDDANFVISELNKKCLVDGEGRPLVAFKPELSEPHNSSSFPGNFNIAKYERSKRTDKYRAVSISHCSQANTIECEMALQWRLLQEIFDDQWKALHERQAEEISLHLKQLRQFGIHAPPSEGPPLHTTPSVATPQHAALSEAIPEPAASRSLEAF